MKGEYADCSWLCIVYLWHHLYLSLYKNDYVWKWGVVVTVNNMLNPWIPLKALVKTVQEEVCINPIELWHVRQLKLFLSFRYYMSSTQPTNVLHRAAGYGSWFNPKKAKCFLQLGRFEVGSFSHHKWSTLNCTRVYLLPKWDHFLNKVWSGCFSLHPSAVFTHAQTNRTKGLI